MQHQQAEDAAAKARIRELAQGLDVFTEDDFALLAGVKPSTTEAWRKRGAGPDYVLLGNRYFYPRAAVARFLTAKIKTQVNVAQAAL